MRLIISAIGKLKSGPEQELVSRYEKRLKGAGKTVGVSKLELVENSESRAASEQQRKSAEAQSLLDRIPSGSVIYAFDERGKSPTSAEFAQNLSRSLESGAPAIAFLIGGPDGLDPSIRKQADHVVSFGALTMPHQIARALVLEQIYRATTILSNHPYHRI